MDYSSKIKNFKREQVIKLIKNSKSIAEVISGLGLKVNGWNYPFVKYIIKTLGGDASHFKGQSWAKGVTTNTCANKIPLNKILIEHSTYTSTPRLKQRLIKEGLLNNKCKECGLSPTWQNKPLMLTIDHINGIREDNRIDNLRLLCPNCHSQTKTFTGRNVKRKAHRVKTEDIMAQCKKYKKITDIIKAVGLTVAMSNYSRVRKVQKQIIKNKELVRCPTCTNTFFPTTDTTKFCSQACAKIASRKCKNRPDKRRLLRMVQRMPMIRIAKIFSVTDNAVRRWCQLYNIAHSEFKFKKPRSSSILGVAKMVNAEVLNTSELNTLTSPNLVSETNIAPPK